MGRMNVLPNDVAKLVQNMGRSCAPAFQAHIVETQLENEENQDPTAKGKDANVAEAAEADAEGSKFLDSEASNAAKELGKQAAEAFQARLATMAHEAVWEDKANGVVPEPADAPFVESAPEEQAVAGSVEPSATPASGTRAATRSGSPPEAKQLFTPAEQEHGSGVKPNTGDKRARDMAPPAETKRRRVEESEAEAEAEAAPAVAAN